MTFRSFVDGSSDACAGLLAHDVATRRSALDALHPDDHEAARYALRDMLLTDANATLRAHAAQRLGERTHNDVVPWLLDATRDAAPIVRETCWRLLAHRNDVSIAPRASQAAQTDPVWWVRRAAVVTVALSGGSETVSLLLPVLADPFWRVRNAAVTAFEFLAAQDPSVRAQVTGATHTLPRVAQAAVEFLRTRWETDRKVETGPTVHEPDTHLWNPDPAVTAARLAERPVDSIRTNDLVELLGDSHETLRRRAARILRRRADLEAMYRALHWLDEPRIATASNTVHNILEALGGRALPLAERVLRDENARVGARVWAMLFAAQHAIESLYRSFVSGLAHASARVRRAAAQAIAQVIPVAPGMVVHLVERICDSDETVRTWAVRAVADSGEPTAIAGLHAQMQALTPTELSLDLRRLYAAAAAHPSVLALDWLRGLLKDNDVWTRALALGALYRHAMLDTQTVEDARSSADPWIRGAVLAIEQAVHVVAHDTSFTLRRAALEQLRVVRETLSPQTLGSLLEATASCPDTALRASVCTLVTRAHVAEPSILRALLLRTRDRTPIVRLAASELLDLVPSRRLVMLELIASLESSSSVDEQLSAAAWAFVVRDRNPADLSAIATALTNATTPARVVDLLRASLALYEPNDLEVHGLQAPQSTARVEVTKDERETRSLPSTPTAAVAKRALGATGLVVSPLALSGVGELAPDALALASQRGTDLFFWEPHYLNLTRYLRRRSREQARVVTGTFHADKRSIERDIDRARRQLRRDTLDVFLLFWARSPERLSAEAFDLLLEYKVRGLVHAVGFSTHHRELAIDAIEQRPWDVVMTRHNAAHQGIEAAFLSAARARNVGVLTFSATCYGRMMTRVPGSEETVSAADCYRYSLSQPGVSAVIAAPRTPRELAANLSVLDRPVLQDDDLARVRAHGQRVRNHHQAFQTYVRRGQVGSMIDDPLARSSLLALLDGPPVAAIAGESNPRIPPSRELDASDDVNKLGS